MSSLAVALPILPGKTPAWQRLIGEVTTNRRAELDGFHRRLGLARVNWYLRLVTVRHSRCSGSGTKLRTSS